MDNKQNPLQLSGKIIEICSAEQGETWKKVTFIIRTGDKYVKDVAFHVWNKNILYIERCRVGDPVNVFFNLESQKYREQWYTEANAWRIDIDLKSLRNESTIENDNSNVVG